MRLPEDFPHTRHEQYVMALPVELLSKPEIEERARVLAAVWAYARNLFLPVIAEAARRGLTKEQLVAALEGPIPPVFARRPT